MSDNALLDRLGDFSADDLHDPQHQVALATAIELRERGVSGSPVTMRTRMGLSGETAQHDLVGAIQAFSNSGTPPSFGDVLACLRDYAARRNLMRIARRLMVQATDPITSLGGAIADAIREADALLADLRPQGRTLLTVQDATNDFLASLQGDVDVAYVPTGFKAIDDLINGLPRGELALLGGRPSMGKSALAIAIALRMAARRYGVLYFSQEMPTSPFLARIASICYWRRDVRALPYSKLQPGKVPAEEHEDLVRATLEGTAPLSLMIEFRRGLTLSEISSTVRVARQTLAKSGVCLDAVVVDHLGLLNAPQRRNSSRANEVGELSDGLCRVAKAENVALLALSQLNREVEKLEDQRPMLAHLRDSGSLEQDASIVMFAYRDAYKLERRRHSGDTWTGGDEADFVAKKNLLEIQVAKNRNGTLGEAELYVDMPSNIVRDYGEIF